MKPNPRTLPACDPAIAGHCVTCADEGVPMRVLEVRPGGLAVCAGEEGGRTDVMTDLVEPVVEGDTLLVHAGTALAKIGAPEPDRSA